jgi:hypothetical protein
MDEAERIYLISAHVRVKRKKKWTLRGREGEKEGEGGEK